MIRDPHPRNVRLALIALVALSALVLGACGEDEPRERSGAPPDYSALTELNGPLGKLYARGDEIREGELDAFNDELERLRGIPIVVNKWASWCAPCRAEFPYFESQAVKRGDEVAFIGVDSQDSRDAAETFLRDNPIPYPSYADPDERIANSLNASPGFPATVFIGAGGEVAEVHIGQYFSEADLARDIRRHLGA